MTAAAPPPKSDSATRWKAPLALAGAMAAGMAVGRAGKSLLAAGFAAVAGLRCLWRKPSAIRGDVTWPPDDPCRDGGDRPLELPLTVERAVDLAVPQLLEIPAGIEAVPSIESLPPVPTAGEDDPVPAGAAPPRTQAEQSFAVPAFAEAGKNRLMAVVEPVPATEQTCEAPRAAGGPSPEDPLSRAREAALARMRTGPHRSVLPQAPVTGPRRSRHWTIMAAAATLAVIFLALLLGLRREPGWFKDLQRRWEAGRGPALEKQANAGDVRGHSAASRNH